MGGKTKTDFTIVPGGRRVGTKGPTLTEKFFATPLRMKKDRGPYGEQPNVSIKLDLSSIPTDPARWAELLDPTRSSLDGEREKGIRLMIQALGDNPDREGLKDTPRRVVKAWKELTAGYGMDPRSLVTTFDSEGYDELVMVGPVEFFSICEHHLLPFFGKAWVGYIPGKSKRIIGLSKLPRLVELFARRLQNQERMTSQIVDTLTTLLGPLGAGCVVSSTHLCASMRGVKQPNAKGVTAVLKGVFRKQPAARAEFMALVEMTK